MASTQLTVRIDPSSKRPAIPSNKVGPDGSCFGFGVADSLACSSASRKAGRVCTRATVLYTDVTSTCVATSDYAVGSSDASVQSRFIGLPLMPSRSLPHTPMSVRNSRYLFTLTFRNELSAPLFSNTSFFTLTRWRCGRMFLLLTEIFGDPVSSPVSYLFISSDLWKFSLVIIVAQRHTFTRFPLIYVNCSLYISRTSHLKRLAPEAIIKSSFYLFVFSLSFPTFTLSCSNECLYLSVLSIRLRLFLLVSLHSVLFSLLPWHIL